MIRRLALVLALASAVPAHAAVILTGSPQYVNVGTLGPLGGSVKSSSGFTAMCELQSSQPSVSPLIGNFSTGAEGNTSGTAPPGGNQSLWIKVQTRYGPADYETGTNGVLIDIGDRNDFGTLWWQTLPVTLGNNVRHQHIVSVLIDGTGTPGSSTSNSGKPIVWYTDGVAYTSWTKEFSSPLGAVANFANPLTIGTTVNNGPVQFNHVTGRYSDCRIYVVNLSAIEVNEIWSKHGRDSVKRGLIRRYPLQGDCTELAAGATCTTSGSPSFSATRELEGFRRRSNVDLPPKNVIRTPLPVQARRWACRDYRSLSSTRTARA